jgi:nitrate/TMAO reductase-like tetraheme cytochrome c subunit
MARILLLLLLACESASDPPSVDTQAPGPEILEAVDDSSDVEFTSAKECGECHPVHYEEWRQSMHAYAAHSPVFDAMASKAFRDTSGAVGTFCTGCHSPMGTAAGEPGTSTADTRSELSLEGVSCDVCHRAIAEDGPIGNANIGYHGGDTKFGPYESPSDDGHGVALGEFLTSPRFCGNCHDVYQYPGLRIEEAYTEYVETGIEEDGIRCQDCHMSPEPGVVADRHRGPIAVDPKGESVYPERELSSHRFIGPDYSLLDSFPYADDPEASAAAQEEYRDQVQTLLENAVGLSKSQFLHTDDGLVELLIGVENKILGHNMPTGFTSERQLWLDIEVTDSLGETVFRTGDLDAYGDLRDSHSWEVIEGTADLDTWLINYQSENRVFQRDYSGSGTFLDPDANESEPTVFPFDADVIVKHSLSPGQIDKSLFQIGPVESGPYQAEIQLHYRNLPPYIMRALQLDDLVPRLEIFTLDSRSLISQ